MKKLSFLWKNVYVFLFFIFTTITFAQSNNCAATPTLSVGATCVTTNYNVAGTFTESGVSVSCGTSLRDGWFTFTTDATTTLIDIQGTSNRRLGLAVYSGACGSLTEVPSACTIPNAANASLTNITVTPSTTYRLRLMRTNGPNTNDMTGTICITKITPPSGNFTCATATTLPCATTNLAGTTLGSSNTAHGTACSMANYGAWYTFVGDGQTTTISSTAGAGYDHEMSISSGSCGSFTNLTCEDSGLSGGTETYTFTTTTGVNYYVYIAHYSSGSTTTGTFTISRTCSPAPTAPVNDLCVNATSLPCGTSNLAGTTVATTNVAHGTGCSMSNYGVWYTFVGDGNLTTISTNPAFDIKLSIATGSCGSLTNIACTDTSPETATFTAVNGTTYYVYVAHWSTSGSTTGTFTISRTCSAPISNDNCSGAVGLTVNPTRTCTTTTAGTIFGATDSGVTGSTCGGTDDDDVWYSFVATASTHYIELLNVAGSTTDLYHAVYAGTCGSLGAAILCSDPNTSTVTGLTIGNTYFIQIYSWSSTTGQTTTFDVCVSTDPACAGTPIAGTTTTSPGSGAPGSSYTVSATGYSTGITGLTFQWQYSTNGGSTWTNQGAATGTYSNYSATAPALGTTVLWHLIVTCTASSQSATSTNGTFTSVSTLNVPATGNNSITCGTNTALYDNGGISADYVNNSNGYTVINAGIGATINISGNYVTESIDYIRIYNGTGTGGTLLATYSGTGSINYTGTVGQTLTIQFTSDSSLTYSGFTLSVTYTGVCNPVPCSGTPTGGTVSTSPNTGWPGSSYTVVATGYTQALNISYQWQYSTDGGTSWINAGASSSSYSNYSATAPTSGLVHWQLEVTCTNSGQVSTSSIGIFTTMVVSDVVTGCPNVVSGGLGLNGADPAAINCTAVSTCVDLEATYLDLGETTDYIVEPILYNPPFAFNGLANPVSVNTDDVWSPIVNLPFDFCFYGNTYNQCVIGSNGILTFNTSVAGGSSGYSFSNNIPISGDGRLLENSIFGVFHDINPGVGGEVGWELITLPTGCRALVASWSDVPMFDENSILYTGMMVLYENSNIIEVYIKEKNIDNFGAGTWNDGNAVVGIQNATGTLASVAPGRNGLDTNWATANEAWRFVPSGNSIASIAWYEGSGTTGPVVGTSPTLSVCPTSTTVYTAEITYTLCDGRTIKEIDETTVTINGAKVWNGSVSTNWNIANNWTPTGVPTAMDCVVIADTANDPIISGTNFNGLGLNLTVDNNATLTVNPDNYLTITDWININTTGDLVLQNSASLIQINNNANQGTMHMTRTANIRKLDYVYWSSPVTSFNLSSVSPGTNGYKYKWTATIPSNINGFGNWNNANEIMTLGKGYIVRGPDNFTSSLAPFNAIFEGTPNNGIISTPISRGTWNGGTYTTGVSSTLGTNDDDNWNLIGNPYPSAIDAIDFLTLNTNVDGFINLWTHGTLPSTAIADPFYEDFVYNYTPGDYITYNSSGASAGPGTFGGTVGAGQGFFVLMNHTSISDTESITFNNSMRSSALDNTQFYRTSNENGKIWLDIVASNGSNVRNLVAYVANATNDRDRMYDAITNEKLNLNLYSLIGNETMKIQGRSLPFDDNDRVPMGIKVPQNGNYTIGIGALEGFFTDNNQNIYLEDLEYNIIHDLRANPYSFTATAGNHANRFVLRYKNETLGGDDIIADESNLWVISSETLSVKSTKIEIQSVRVFDVLGRELAFYPNVNSYEIPLTKIQKNNSGLIIQVTLSNGTTISKKVIY
jgi:hypothetical protein